MSDTFRIVIKRTVHADGTCTVVAEGCMPYPALQGIEANLMMTASEEGAPFTAEKRADGSIVVTFAEPSED